MLTANFIANGFPAMAGSYNGLAKSSPILPAPGGTVPGVGTEGLFSATVEKTGTFSGKLTLDGAAHTISGLFDTTGTARFGRNRATSINFARTGKPTLTVALNLAPPGGTGKLTGTVTQNSREVLVAASAIEAARAHYNGTTAVVPDAYLTINGTVKTNGVFTSFIKAQPLASQPEGFIAADYPQGEGYAALTVTKGGIVSLTGTLADGTALTASAPLSEQNVWPVFAQLYNKGGFISGEVALDSGDPDSDMSATGILWARPFQNVQHYPYGWPEVIKADLFAAKYAPKTGESVLKVPGGAALPAPDADGNATLTMRDGRLTTPFIRKVKISTYDLVTKIPTTDTSFALTIARATGKFTGTFTHNGGVKPAFQGMIYQQGAHAGGHGYFLTTKPAVIDYLGESGGVSLLGEP